MCARLAQRPARPILLIATRSTLPRTRFLPFAVIVVGTTRERTLSALPIL